MSGMQNKRSSGRYIGIHSVYHDGDVVQSTTTAQQATMVGGSRALFEGSRFDTCETMHPLTQSEIEGMGVQVNAINGPAKAISGSSKIFKINGYRTNQNLTCKNQNLGNCTHSSMLQISMARSHFEVLS